MPRESYPSQTEYGHNICTVASFLWVVRSVYMQQHPLCSRRVMHNLMRAAADLHDTVHRTANALSTMLSSDEILQHTSLPRGVRAQPFSGHLLPASPDKEFGTTLHLDQLFAASRDGVGILVTANYHTLGIVTHDDATFVFDSMPACVQSVDSQQQLTQFVHASLGAFDEFSGTLIESGTEHRDRRVI